MAEGGEQRISDFRLTMSDFRFEWMISLRSERVMDKKG